jgi:sodium transport system permease protein
VLVVPPDFEAELAAASSPSVEVVTDSANTRAQGRRAAACCGCCAASTRSRPPAPGAARRLAGGAAGLVQVRNATWPTRPRAPRSSRCMLPFFVLMAVLYGALNAALDTTAGERERGSLEPLLMNPSVAPPVPGAGQMGRRWPRWAC